MYLYFGDHDPPHIHANYGGEVAVLEFRTDAVRAGYLPPAQLSLVRRWMAACVEELEEA